MSRSPTGGSSISGASSLSIPAETIIDGVASYGGAEGLAGGHMDGGMTPMTNAAGAVTASTEHLHPASGVTQVVHMNVVGCSPEYRPSDFVSAAGCGSAATNTTTTATTSLYSAAGMALASEQNVGPTCCDCLGSCGDGQAACMSTVQTRESANPRRRPRPLVVTSDPNMHRPLHSPYGSVMTDYSSATCSIPSPAPSARQMNQLDDQMHCLRYPALRPLIPHLTPSITPALACDLLELFFADFARVGMHHPLSPYLLGHAFRKESLLHPVRPRVCSPALLASILWVAARAHQKGSRPTQSSEQKALSRDLMDLTLRLLNLRISDPSRGTLSGSATPIGGTAYLPDSARLGVYGHADAMSPCLAAPSAPSIVDDIATYINLAVMSARDSPSQSLPWWKAAWSIARGEKMYMEAPYGPTVRQVRSSMAALSAEEVDAGLHNAAYLHSESAVQHGPIPSAPQSPGIQIKIEHPHDTALWFATEEQREERRRIWWLLYIMDRHMALCCERPLAFSAGEGHALLKPMDEGAWQAGDFRGQHTDRSPLAAMAEETSHSGPSFFTTFLPVMVLVGKTIQPMITRR